MFDWRRKPGRRRASAPEAKDSAAGPLIAFAHAGRPVWTPRDYDALAREGFARNPVAYRCVRMIAEAAAATPLAVFEHGERAGPDHWLTRLLARPNPEQSGAELFEALHGSLQTSGNAYLEAAGDGLEELYVLRPDRVKVAPGPNGWPAAYDYTVGGRTVRLARAADGFSPVLHVRLFNPTDDWYGFSPMEAAAFAIDVHNASGAWNKALLDNAARPSGALVYGGHLTDEQFQTLRSELTEHPGGAIGAMDQSLGSGDGARTAFQLVKAYGDVLREIRKPVDGSVRVAVAGEELPPGAFTVDPTTGLVELDGPPASGAEVSAGFAFDTPVRFDADRIELTLESFGAGRMVAMPLIELRI